MTSPTRIVPVGNYEVLHDHDWPQLSVRVFRLLPGGPIEPHVHQRSMQVYVALKGTALITVDGVEAPLRPYEARQVWPGSVHSATTEDEECVVMNISVPRLEDDDRLPVAAAVDTPDMRMPTADDDVEE